jgi:hypothetical protein
MEARCLSSHARMQCMHACLRHRLPFDFFLLTVVARVRPRLTHVSPTDISEPRFHGILKGRKVELYAIPTRAFGDDSLARADADIKRTNTLEEDSR